jgi:hypothetical protein
MCNHSEKARRAMSCCGNKRAAAVRRGRPRRAANRAPTAVGTEPTRVVFRGTGAYLVTGPHSGHVYRFSSDQPVNLEDPMDLPGLVRTGLFRPASAGPASSPS